MIYDDFIELTSKLLSNLSDLSEVEVQYVLENSELDMHDIKMLEDMMRLTDDYEEVEDYLHSAGVDVYYLANSIEECVDIQDKILYDELQIFC